MRIAPLLLLPVLAACWKTDPTTLPEGKVDFAPEAGSADGWVVEKFAVDVECPDGEDAGFYVIYPDGAVGSLPVAVILHSGAFDYVPSPPTTDPLAGPHFQEEDRLSREWAVRRVFATLGMYDDGDRFEDSTGALATALAERGVAMVIPANCWGDWWHNQAGLAENDFGVDRFTRNGRFAAEFAWRMASEPGFSLASSMPLPVGFDPEQAYLIGIGEGGRGVGELLAAGYTPTGVLVDSSADDLRTYFADPVLYERTVAGLLRIFPEGEAATTAAMIGSQATLPRIAYLYSSLDTQIPTNAHDAALARLASHPEAWVYDAAVQKHVITGTDLTVARDALNFLIGDTSGGGDTDTAAP